LARVIAMVVQQRGREAAILGTTDPRHECLITLCGEGRKKGEERAAQGFSQ